MKVSIVTVVFNSVDFIRDCIQSVVIQDYDRIEYIVIDGNSTDGTLEILQSYLHQIHVFRSEADQGMYYALNKGIGLATGEVIGILNSDDFFAAPDVISSIVNCFKARACDAVYGNLNMIRRYGTRKVVRQWRSGPYKQRDLELGWMPAHPTFYVRKSVFDRHQMYRPAFGASADYDLVLRFLYLHRIQAVFIDRVLVYMRLGGMSNGSVKKQLRIFWQDVQALKENGIANPLIAALAKRIRKLKQFL